MQSESRRSARHLELGVFAPTIGCMPPAADRSFCLISSAEQRTDITFAYNRRVAEILERAGLEIFFMAQRMGAGFGPSRFWGTSLDSFTTAAALAMVTERIKIVSTVHTALFHPGMVARIGATLDQISGGRWGLNIVSGWSGKDFHMLGVPLREHDERYRLSAEFIEVLKKFWTEDWFDYTGRYFTIRQGVCEPKPVQRPYPPLYNAGSSPAGRGLTARYCDCYFTGAPTPEQGKVEIADIRAQAAAYGRQVSCFTYAFILCRDSEAQAQKEVEEIFAQADHEGAREFVEALSGQTIGTLKSAFGQGSVEEMVQKAILGVGSPIVGTPEQVAEALFRLQEAGVDGVLLTFRHVREELEEFIEKVLPRLEQMGVRQPCREI
jgi:FMNH2-dependent dimethyl sulfone monooxygenase